jgi:hypothetical protein
MSDILNAKDREHLVILFEKSNGQAWEPPAPNHPWLVKLIDAGYLKRCDMRCGFEAFKDSGVTWTQAGRDAIAAMKEAA